MEVVAIIMVAFAALLAVERKKPDDVMSETGEVTDTVVPIPILSLPRSDGGLFLLRDGGTDHFNMMRFHVCRTGAMEQFYTLYQEVVIYSNYGMNHQVVYCGNLAHDKAIALKKAYKRAWRAIKTGMWHDVHVDFHASARKVSKNYYAFTDDNGDNGIEMKLARSGKCYWGRIQGDAGDRFWDLWKEDKDSIREAGFWPKRMDYQWMLFMKAQIMDVDYEREIVTYAPDDD